jgi:hypothetical protein
MRRQTLALPHGAYIAGAWVSVTLLYSRAFPIPRPEVNRLIRRAESVVAGTLLAPVAMGVGVLCSDDDIQRGGT